MEENNPSLSQHPFSQLGYRGFIFDLFMEGSLPDFFSDKITNIPSGREFLITRHVALSEKEDINWVVGDIPAYMGVHLSESAGNWEIKRIPQYLGYGIDLTPYEDFTSFITDQLSKKSLRNLHSKMRKLEASGRVTYTFYYGGMDKQAYVDILSSFYDMLKTRFEEIRMYNRNLIHWPYFYNSVYKKILNKKAYLFVIEKNGIPIAISLDYINGKTIFGLIQSFDSSFARYNLGDIAMFKKLEWCFLKDYSFFDLSKGDSFFKRKWANYPYLMEYMIFYSGKGIKSRALAGITKYKLKLRQYLRDKGVLGKWFQFDKFFYKKQMKRLDGFDWKKEAGL